MGIGQLTQFPINTILEFATSAQYGICPQLCGSVSVHLSACSPNHAVSERGIRLALDAIDTSVDYTNLGVGQPIYASLIAPTAFYNTLSGTSNYITGFISGNTLFLSGYGDTGGSTAVITGTQNISVQGGKYQYSDTIQASAIQTSGYIIGYPVQDDVLAKTFVKCTIPFEQNGSSYSIGVSAPDWENKTLITSAFSTPSAAGLVSFGYSDTMSGEYYWLTGDSELRIYRFGSQASSGEIGVSVFYDNVVWSPSYGYNMGQYTESIDIQRYNMNFDYLDSSTRTSPEAHMEFYTAIANNSYVYCAGGETSGPTNYNNISRYETKNDTVSLIDRGDLTVSRGRLASTKSSTKAYFAGGLVGATTEQTVIDNIQFSNDTANAVANANLNQARTSFYAVQSSTDAYFAAGVTDPTTYYTSIEKMTFSSDTSVSTIAGTVNTGREGLQGWSTSLYGYLTCGRNVSSSVNHIDKINFSDDSVATKTSAFPVPHMYGYTVQTSSEGYTLGGLQPESGSNLLIVQKINFNSDTVSIAQGQLLEYHFYQWGASV